MVPVASIREELEVADSVLSFESSLAEDDLPPICKAETYKNVNDSHQHYVTIPPEFSLSL